MKTRLIQTEHYLLLIDEEGNIKQADYYLLGDKMVNLYKGVFPKRPSTKLMRLILAYYPLSSKSPKLDLLLLPKPIQRELTLKEHETLGDLFIKKHGKNLSNNNDECGNAFGYFIEGYILSQSKLPKEFNPEYITYNKSNDNLKVVTNSEGNVELVGEYKY